MTTRRRSLELIGAALLLPGCGANAGHAVRIGSQSTGENATFAEIYALALERASIRVERRPNLGGTNDAMAALRRGDIDVYPGLLETSPGKLRPAEERTLRGIAWLAPAPVDESPCLVTSEYAAEQYWLLSLTKCAALAPKLRLAATHDFIAPGGILERLQRLHGRFRFKHVLVCERGTQYYALNRGEADVANAMRTDASIAENRLMILQDDLAFFPRYNVAPAVRLDALHAQPRLRTALNRISRRLTTFAVQQMNMRRELLSMDPRDVAEDFVRRILR